MTLQEQHLKSVQEKLGEDYHVKPFWQDSYAEQQKKNNSVIVAGEVFWGLDYTRWCFEVADDGGWGDFPLLEMSANRAVTLIKNYFEGAVND